MADLAGTLIKFNSSHAGFGAAQPQYSIPASVPATYGDHGVVVGVAALNQTATGIDFEVTLDASQPAQNVRHALARKRFVAQASLDNPFHGPASTGPSAIAEVRLIAADRVGVGT